MGDDRYEGHPCPDSGNASELAALRAENERLREDVKRYRLFLEDSPLGWQCLDDQGRITEVNQAWCDMLGFDMDDVLGRHILDFLDPSAHADFPAFFEEFKLHGRICARRVDLRHKNGDLVQVSVEGRVARDESGAFLRTQCVLRDVGEELRVKRDTDRLVGDLRSLLAATQSLLDTSDFEATAQAVFAECSGAVGSTCGFVSIFEDDGESQRIVHVEHGEACDPRPPASTRFLDGIRQRAFETAEVIAVNDFRASRWASFLPEKHPDLQNVLLAPMFIQGKPLGMIGLGNKPGGFDDRDRYLARTFAELSAVALSNLRTMERLAKSEERCRLAMSRAEQANMAKSEFLANMSHELRTPLNGVMGMLQLAQATNLAPDQAELVEMALTASRGLLSIINDILDFAVLGEGRYQLRREPFDLAATVESVVSVFEHQAENKHIELAVDIDPRVPRLVKGDPGRVRQILFNIVGNAVKFTDMGRIELKLAPRPAGEGEVGLDWTVRDTGCGIPADKLEAVFEPFTQVDGSFTRVHQGTGLGLGIVKRLLELMDGEIHVESQEGTGTTVRFSMVMDRHEEQAREPEASPGQPEPAKSPPADATGRLLIVEDNRINMLAAKRFAERLGWEADTAENGREALEMLAGQRYDCVLMDVQMPELDGVEATRMIRRGEGGVLEPATPIVAMTAYAMHGDRDQFLAAGMNDYVAKPVEMGELSRVLGRVLVQRDGEEVA